MTQAKAVRRLEIAERRSKPIDEWFAEAIGNLALRMQSYDRLSAEQEAESGALTLIEEDLRAHRINRTTVLSELDNIPHEVALDGTRAYVLTKRLEVIKSDIQRISGDVINNLLLDTRLVGKKVEITAHDGYQLERIYALDDRKFTDRKGRVTSAGLNVTEGGWIDITGKVREYRAAPLIDRENDYQPAFDIKILD